MPKEAAFEIPKKYSNLMADIATEMQNAMNKIIQERAERDPDLPPIVGIVAFSLVVGTLWDTWSKLLAKEVPNVRPQVFAALTLEFASKVTDVEAAIDAEEKQRAATVS